MVSEKYTMRGYKFKEFLRGNKERVKVLVIAVAGYSTWAMDFIEDPVLKGLTAAVVAGLVALLGDGIDYWLSE